MRALYWSATSPGADWKVSVFRSGLPAKELIIFIGIQTPLEVLWGCFEGLSTFSEGIEISRESQIRPNRSQRWEKRYIIHSLKALGRGTSKRPPGPSSTH